MQSVSLRPGLSDPSQSTASDCASPGRGMNTVAPIFNHFWPSPSGDLNVICHHQQDISQVHFHLLVVHGEPRRAQLQPQLSSLSQNPTLPGVPCWFSLQFRKLRRPTGLLFLANLIASPGPVGFGLFVIVAYFTGDPSPLGQVIHHSQYKDWGPAIPRETVYWARPQFNFIAKNTP